MNEECRRCGATIDVRKTDKGTRMAIGLEKEQGGTVELRESRIAGGGVIAVRVPSERGVERYVEHSKVCRPRRPARKGDRTRGIK